jgi:hypothetical protein
MPRFRGQGLPMDAHMTAALPFFVQANYRFSTNEPGRPSTLYFEDMVGRRGRYRRGHAQGSELIFQGHCHRIFVSPMLKGQLSDLTTGGVFEDNLNAFTYAKFMHKLIDVLQVNGGGGPLRQVRREI